MTLTLDELRELRAALDGVMKPEFIATWFDSPCEELGGLTPRDAIDRGEMDRVWRVVLLLGSGMPT